MDVAVHLPSAAAIWHTSLAMQHVPRLGSHARNPSLPTDIVQNMEVHVQSQLHQSSTGKILKGPVSGLSGQSCLYNLQLRGNN